MAGVAFIHVRVVARRASAWSCFDNRISTVRFVAACASNRLVIIVEGFHRMRIHNRALAVSQNSAVSCLFSQLLIRTMACLANAVIDFSGFKSLGLGIAVCDTIMRRRQRAFVAVAR